MKTPIGLVLSGLLTSLIWLYSPARANSETPIVISEVSWDSASTGRLKIGDRFIKFSLRNVDAPSSNNPQCEGEGIWARSTKFFMMTLTSNKRVEIDISEEKFIE